MPPLHFFFFLTAVNPVLQKLTTICFTKCSHYSFFVMTVTFTYWHQYTILIYIFCSNIVKKKKIVWKTRYENPASESHDAIKYTLVPGRNNAGYVALDTTYIIDEPIWLRLRMLTTSEWASVYIYSCCQVSWMECNAEDRLLQMKGRTRLRYKWPWPCVRHRYKLGGAFTLSCSSPFNTCTWPYELVPREVESSFILQNMTDWLIAFRMVRRKNNWCGRKAPGRQFQRHNTIPVFCCFAEKLFWSLVFPLTFSVSPVDTNCDALRRKFWIPVPIHFLPWTILNQSATYIPGSWLWSVG